MNRNQKPDMLTTCSRGLSIFGDGVYSIQTWASSVGVPFGRRIEQPVGLHLYPPISTKTTQFMDTETSDLRGLRILSLGIQKPVQRAATALTIQLQMAETHAACHNSISFVSLWEDWRVEQGRKHESVTSLT